MYLLTYLLRARTRRESTSRRRRRGRGRSTTSGEWSGSTTAAPSSCSPISSRPARCDRACVCERRLLIQTHTRGAVNNHIKKGLLLSLWVKFFYNRWIFGKVTSKSVVVTCTLRTWPTYCWKTKKVHETITFLLVTLPNIYQLKNFHARHSNKLFLINNLTTPLICSYTTL